jgi:hypothetical protein
MGPSKQRHAGRLTFVRNRASIDKALRRGIDSRTRSTTTAILKNERGWSPIFRFLRSSYSFTFSEPTKSDDIFNFFKNFMDEGKNQVKRIDFNENPDQQLFGLILSSLDSTTFPAKSRSIQKLEVAGKTTKSSSLQDIQETLFKTYFGFDNMPWQVSYEHKNFGHCTLEVNFENHDCGPKSDIEKMKCWSDFIAYQYLHVGDFVTRYFLKGGTEEKSCDESGICASMEPLILLDAVDLGFSKQEPLVDKDHIPIASTAQSFLIEPATHRNTYTNGPVELKSIQPRKNLQPRFVDLAGIESRRKAFERLDEIIDCTPWSPDVKPSHSFIVISGELGIGKSDFIYQWLAREREKATPNFSKLLYVESFSGLSKDTVIRDIETFMKTSREVPVIVIDGIRSFGATKTAEEIVTDEIVRALIEKSGHKKYVAILGVQILNRHWETVQSTSSVTPIHLPRLNEAESLIYLKSLWDEDKAPASKKQLDEIIGDCHGLPILLEAAATQDDDFKSSQPQRINKNIPTKISKYLQAMNTARGDLYAAMRLVSLFRRPLVIEELQSIVEDVMELGQTIERIDPRNIKHLLKECPYITLGTMGGVVQVELQPFMKRYIHKELEESISQNAQLRTELRMIHLTMARKARKEYLDEYGHTDHSKYLSASKREAEYLLDCAYHLAFTRRRIDTDAMPLNLSRYDNWREINPKATDLEAKVFAGIASDDDIEKLCFDFIHGHGRLKTNAMSSMGMNPQKIQVLVSLCSRWKIKANNMHEPLPIHRRKILHELAVCSMVAGKLAYSKEDFASLCIDQENQKEKHIAHIVAEPAKDDLHKFRLAIDYCAEVAKVRKSYCTALLRMGNIEAAKEAIEAVEHSITSLAIKRMKEAERESSAQNPIANRNHHATGSDWTEDIKNRVKYAHSRLLVKLGEIKVLSTDFIREKNGSEFCLKSLLYAEELFNEAIQLLTPKESTQSYSNPAIANTLHGESLRAHLKCLMKLAHWNGLTKQTAQHSLHDIRELVLRHLKEAESNNSQYDGWNNDSLAFKVDLAVLQRLNGKFSEAKVWIKNVLECDIFQRIQGASFALGLEARLENMKISICMLLSKEKDNAAEIEMELQDICTLAENTQHRQFWLDGVILKFILSSISKKHDSTHRTKYCELAEIICRQMRGYRARNDVMRIMSNGCPNGVTLEEIQQWSIFV